MSTVKKQDVGQKLTWLSKRIDEVRKRRHPPGISSLGTEFITKWFKNNSNLSQIYSSGLEFAFVNQAGQQCHEFAFCKDYLQDAVWATVNKSSSSIYGFFYSYRLNPQLDLNNMRLGVRQNGGKNLEKNCKNALKFLQEVDKVQGFAPSTLLLGGKRKGEKGKTFVFVSDKAWLHSSVMISLYTLLIRVGMTYKGGDWKHHFSNAETYLGSNDKSYAASAKKGLDKIIGKSPSVLFATNLKDNYPKAVNISTMHNSSGIVAYSKGPLHKSLTVNWKK